MKPITFGSVCSGIEAASVAWHPLGWTTSFVSEIEPFPRAVLAHHYPDVPLHGDFTTIQKGDYADIDVLVGGTPCQSFSVAGLRKGLDCPRGNLMLEFGALARRLSPRWIVWENVPGVLSSNRGRDFGTFLGMLGECGYGVGYRILDAQYFGVAQRRRRVFVVGYLGDWRRAAAVLFERASLFGSLEKSGSPRKEVAGTVAARFGISRNNHEECVVQPIVMATGQSNAEIAFGQVPTLNCNHEAPIIANTLRPPSKGAAWRGDGSDNIITLSNDPATSICANEGKTYTNEGKMFQLRNVVAGSSMVRRLTPRECERLQGFPDDYTDITWLECCGELVPEYLGAYGCPNCEGEKKARRKRAADTHRYKAIGNSMAVPVIAWLGRRIEDVEQVEGGRHESH